MSYNLSKEQEYSLVKDGEELSHVKAYLHWFTKIEGDLDASAFLLGKDGFVVDHDGFVFYNSVLRTALPEQGDEDSRYYFTHHFDAKKTLFDREVYGTKVNWKKETRPMSSDGAVLGSYDDKGENVNENGELYEADETININLDKVSPTVEEIVICVTIHPDPKLPDFSFKNVIDPYIEIINDDNDEQLCKFELRSDFSTETAVEVGKFYNYDGVWRFKAIGKGYDGGLQTFVDIYAE